MVKRHSVRSLRLLCHVDTVQLEWTVDDNDTTHFGRAQNGVNVCNNLYRPMFTLHFLFFIPFYSILYVIITHILLLWRKISHGSSSNINRNFVRRKQKKYNDTHICSRFLCVCVVSDEWAVCRFRLLCKNSRLSAGAKNVSTCRHRFQHQYYQPPSPYALSSTGFTYSISLFISNRKSKRRTK